ncbi:MAG: response regulator transcription factor [Pacificimonas sp.]
MPRTILIVDDDPHIRELLSFAFQKAGLAVREAGDGEQAEAMIADAAPDLVVLDINMPKMDGIELCRRIRRNADGNGDLPIMFLSSRDEEIDRVLGIELGAVDYVVKPFSPREVVARAQAILRRTAAKAPDVAADSQAARGLLALDADGWRATWGGAEVALTRTEFSLIQLLASLPGKVFSRDAIIDRLHGPGFAVTDRTIDSHVRGVRAKFANVGGTDVIETRAGIGYQLGPCVGE